MSFNIEAKPRFTETVTVHSPGGETSDFKCVFNALDDANMDLFNLGTTEGSKDFLVAAIAEVDDVVDNKGHAVPSSPDLVASLIDLPWVRPALARAYFTGLTKGREGN